MGRAIEANESEWDAKGQERIQFLRSCRSDVIVEARNRTDTERGDQGGHFEAIRDSYGSKEDVSSENTFFGSLWIIS